MPIQRCVKGQGVAHKCRHIAQWESAQPNLDLPNIEARRKVSA